MSLTHRAFCSGDVLLSHGLSPYYHWGCSVSLPCSEWERVEPLRYYHQRPEPGRAVSVLRTEKGRRRSLMTASDTDALQSGTVQRCVVATQLHNCARTFFTSYLAEFVPSCIDMSLPRFSGIPRPQNLEKVVTA